MLYAKFFCISMVMIEEHEGIMHFDEIKHARGLIYAFYGFSCFVC